MNYTKEGADAFKKSGVELWEYVGDGDLDQADVLYIEVDGGHNEEFYHDESAFIYYVLDGEGTFYLDGDETPVSETDVVAIPPETKIYYTGKMNLLLVTAPEYQAEHEHVVREVEIE